MPLEDSDNIPISNPPIYLAYSCGCLVVMHGDMVDRDFQGARQILSDNTRIKICRTHGQIVKIRPIARHKANRFG